MLLAAESAHAQLLQKVMLRKCAERWKSYRYRLVPWLVFNLKNRTVRAVTATDQDKTTSDKKLLHVMKVLFQALNDHESAATSQEANNVLDVMNRVLGFKIEKCHSSIAQAGKGVFVTEGQVTGNSLVAFYPGTIYWPHEPILIQSIRNPFIFRCIDGILIDGNDKGLSRMIYRSNAGRDWIGPYSSCDKTWLTESLLNPLAIGQYINNGSKHIPANVAYQELDVPLDKLPLNLLKYIPNVWYSSGNIGHEGAFIRTVVLVSLRDISEGEELFSSYFTVVH